MTHRLHHAALGTLLLLGLLLGACSPTRYHGVLAANQRPVLRLTQAPSSASATYFYAYEMRWAAYDPDGSIDHYLYCVDPPSAAGVDTPWVSTTDNRHTFEFQSPRVDSVANRVAKGFHTFVLKAVDNGGLASATATCAFNSYTIAPTVQITAPTLNHLFTPTFGPSFRITWTGTDPDGRTSVKPVKYKYKLFADDNTQFDFLTALVNPDSVRRYYAPSFTGWDSVGGDTTALSVRDLLPNHHYILALVAFDEVGAYSPVFNFDTNMIYFNVDYAGRLGPTMTVYNESFYYAATAGSFSLDAASWIHTDAAADQPLSFHWSATPQAGGYITGYRWRVDGDVGDETPRSDELRDIRHWSQWSVGQTGVTLPPFSPIPPSNTETHFLYVEGRDDNDQVSIVVVQFNCIRPTFEKSLLIFNDTRFAPDKIVSGKIDRPRGTWPTAAEIDTFLFAVGGKTWKSYPTGTLSPPGVFQGYDADTLNGRFVPNGIATLEMLSHYRHIVWMTDFKSATNNNPPDYASGSQTSSLHAMSYRGASNPLATWVKQGGRLWLLGGGAATSLQREWEKTGTSGTVFSNTDGELVPGRFMYDITHWCSEITVGSSAQARKYAGLTGGWPGAPDYSVLPDLLFEKSPAVDPINTYAPWRTSPSDYYQTTYNAECLSKPNAILEPSLTGGDAVSALDTLYMTVGGVVGSDRPVMTIYHGGASPPVVYTGFPLWYFRRDLELNLVDFVLQNCWGLPRRPVVRRPQR